MTELPELEAAYRGMTPWARSMLLDTARQYLKKWPAPQVRPLLTKVPKDSVIQSSPNVLNGNSDRVALVLVRKSKN